MSKLTVTLDSVAQLEVFNEFKAIKRYIVGNNKYGLRLSTSFEVQELQTIINLAHEADKEVFIAITKIFHEQELSKLESYLQELKTLESSSSNNKRKSPFIDGIIFSDFAVYQLLKKYDFVTKTLYSTDTTITNNSFTELAANHGISEIELAKEITLKEILEINKKKQVPLTVAVHGHIYMYHSSRPLIDNYLKDQEDKGNYTTKEHVDGNGEVGSIPLNQKDLYLYDEERKNYYPIAQNETDTHILSNQDFCGIKFIPKFVEHNIDNLKLDGFGYKSLDFIKIVEIYNRVLLDNITDNKELISLKKDIDAITPYHRYGNGFMQKPTVY